jgi:WS/DGAT/MGAT family acyltransferase
MTGPRLSPLDASFLAIETPTAHMHVGWAATFAPPAEGPRPGFEELRDHIAARLCRAPRYRQRIESMPLDLTTPIWVDDTGFDIAHHVVRAGPGSFRDAVDRCLSTPLDHDRPLWQVSIADRLPDGRIGLVGKVHHCMVDGIAAVELASLLLDPDPQAPRVAVEDWRPQPPPSRLELLLRRAAGRSRELAGLARAPLGLARSPRRALELTTKARAAAVALASSLRPATPVAALNEPISPLRHLGTATRPLDDLKRVKAAFGATLNDVFLAVVAGAIRRQLVARGGLPPRLKAMVPVNVRVPGAEAELGNRISFMFVDLPCGEPDPVRRLREVQQEVGARKEADEPEGARMLLELAAQTPPPVQAAVSRLVASPRTFNLTVSNIPGPPKPLYMRGCRLEETYPVVPLADGHALSIGMTTVCDAAFFGLYADRAAAADSDELAELVDAEIDLLLEATEEREGLAVMVAGGG